MRWSSSWRSWLFAVLILAGVSEATYGPKVTSCWKNWLKMTDDNYLRALERYQNCGTLVEDLPDDMKQKYKRSLVDNLQRSSNYFFDHTEMSPAEVIRVLRGANSLMESLSKGDKLESQLVCDDVWDEPAAFAGEELPCSDKAMSWFAWTRFIYQSYMVLLVIQSLLLLMFFCKVCCTDLLTSMPACSYEAQNNDQDVYLAKTYTTMTCCCQEDKEWITKLITDCENQIKSRGAGTEAYPLLLDHTTRAKCKPHVTVGYGTNIGRRGKNEDDILTDLSPLSSPRIGSDSEFEALMNRRPLRHVKKPR